jgi:hypothetical protein
VSGDVRDADRRPIADSLVVPLDAATGRPLLAGELRLVQGVEELADAVQSPPRRPDCPRLLCAYSDQEGKFSLPLPAGAYRLIAVRAPGSPSPPTPLGLHGELIQIDGVSDPVAVGAAEEVMVNISSLGRCALRIESDIGNDDAYLFVSRHPPAADPVLGFAGWNDDFFGQLVAAVRLDHGSCEIRGLPEGALHFTIFANDNNPGFGGASVDLQADRVEKIHVPIVASWSDGHKEPPEHLRELVGELEADPQLAAKLTAEFERVMAQDRPDEDHPLRMFHRLQQHLDDSVALPDGRKLPLRDVAAAIGYYRLRK